jgi:hypothetical protein
VIDNLPPALDQQHRSRDVLLRDRLVDHPVGFCESRRISQRRSLDSRRVAAAENQQ